MLLLLLLLLLLLPPGATCQPAAASGQQEDAPAAANAGYLQQQLVYGGDKLLDADGEAVRRAWQHCLRQVVVALLPFLEPFGMSGCALDGVLLDHATPVMSRNRPGTSCRLSELQSPAAHSAEHATCHSLLS